MQTFSNEPPDWAVFLFWFLMRVKRKGRASMSNSPIEIPGVLVHKEGNSFSSAPLTARAKAWSDEHVELEGHGAALVVEHRYALGLAQGMKNAGLVLW
jgi:hypothetical protein